MDSSHKTNPAARGIIDAELVYLPGFPLLHRIPPRTEPAPLTADNWRSDQEVRELADKYLPAVVGLALRETVRTPAEQDALLALARLVANPMWPADQEAEATWKHSPCEDCGYYIPPGVTRCLRCAAKAARTP